MRRIPELLVQALLWLPLAADAQAPLQGEIRFQAAGDTPGWVGEERQLHLELWSNGFRFGEQQFVLPEVSGGFLLQADASTVKLSENRAGESWQGLRYTLLLYPQKAGRLEVPGFDVAFNASAGFGTEPAAFRFRTDPVFVESRLPPGAAPGLLVTTRDFSMSASWNPSRPAEGALALRVGDALTLDVARRARDVPGMVFAPLAAPEVAGLAAYPARPELNDSVNRGALTGERSDSITFICEREGRFEIPAIRFQWWDPVREALNEEVIPTLAIEVSANPAIAASPGGAAAGSGVPFGRGLLALLLLAGLAAATRWWLWPVLSRALQRRRIARESGEAWSFHQARKACAGGVPATAYNAIGQWLTRLDPAVSAASLTRLADRHGDDALRQEAEALQLAVATGSPYGWDGTRLARMLQQFRDRLQRRSGRQGPLQSLNPRGSEQGDDQQGQQD